ncbi:uncharacterized protein LOC111223062 isoform X1 [Seriola dumerili]|uniref:uncharacterized protein LOC111223062 isoform X1 n=1 Tax=Seriola dumerili TaxID=41447 RepID=UPI000BBEFC3A|nr:uncharacterized protein LOC111223062 isoform X1 [Seriola dumerili]
MAGLCVLKILLLWTGIISLANSPDDMTKLKTTAPEPHVIIVSCEYSRRFNGPEVMYITQHRYAGDTLHVTAFNEHFEHKSKTYDVATHYHDKAVIDFLAFLIVLTSVAILVVIDSIYVLNRVPKHRKSRDVNENAMFQTAASLRSLKTLLLSAGIICQITTTAGQRITASSPLECSYTVTPIKFGFQIDIKSSTPRNYTININEEGRPDTGKHITVHQSSQSSSHEIKHLKPCTEYEHYVTHLDGAGEKHCSHTEDKTKTTDISKDDIEDVSCIPGRVCYRSDWDISSLLSTTNAVRCDNKTFCVKPGYNDICSDFTTKFTSEKCPTTSFSLTKSFIPVDFLNASEIHQIVSTKLPVKIETKLPPNCKNLSVDYTCRESGGVTEPKLESELEPFTDYSCTGQIKDNDVTIKNTTAVYVRIDCDFNIIATKNNVTNTSIGLSWSTTSDKCQEVLHELDKLSYDCSCGPTPSHQTHRSKANKESSGGTCLVSGLEPFTTYTCEVKPIYNNIERDAKQTPVTQVTEAGIPDDIKDLRTSQPEHNVIIVTCIHSGKLNGPEGKQRYRAELHHGGVIVKELKEKECKFEFRDLSYSTTYTVKVTAFNRHFESKPQTIPVATLDSGKALTVTNILDVLIIIIIIIIIINILSAALVYKICVLRHRKSRNDVKGDVMFESTAIYVNAPESAWRPTGEHPDGAVY